MFRTEEDNHRNGPDLERRGTARPNTVTTTTSLHSHQGEGSARRAVANDAVLGCPGLDQLPHNQGVASNNKRSRKNKTKKKKRKKNFQKG